MFQTTRQHFDHLPRSMFHPVSPPLVVGYEHMLLYFGASVVPIPPLCVHTPKVHESACFADDHIFQKCSNCFNGTKSIHGILPKPISHGDFPLNVLNFSMFPMFSNSSRHWMTISLQQKTAIHGDPWLGPASAKAQELSSEVPLAEAWKGNMTIRCWLVGDLPWKR